MYQKLADTAHRDRRDPIRPRRGGIAGYSNLNCFLSGLTRAVEFGLLSIIYSFFSLILGEAAQGLTRAVEFGLLSIIYSFFSLILGEAAQGLTRAM